jgi:hypothetical protein
MTSVAGFAAFFEDLQRRIGTIREYRQELNRFVAQDFNLLDFLRPVEYRMSELIAFLLDPRGVHGQGAAFLQAFLDRLDTVPVALELKSRLIAGQKVDITLEEPTRARRRIDILVSIGQAAVGIENKPWAADQLAQLADYASDLEVRFPLHWALVYLRGDGRIPSEDVLPSERRGQLRSSGRYVEWCYVPDIADWVGICTKLCEADKMRWLLRDFHTFVLNTFRPTESGAKKRC